MTIKAVSFDVFGTLVRIAQPTKPFRKLLTRKLEDSRRPGVGAKIMSKRLDLRGAATLLDITLSPQELSDLENDLVIELNSIELFDDVQQAFSKVRESGLQIAICSNLALPYGDAAARLLPFAPDFCAWSYDAHAVKPDPAMYQYLCDGLGCPPEEILMIGDSLAADVFGPRSFGIHAIHLRRNHQLDTPENSVGTLAEIPEIVARLNSRLTGG